MSQESNYVNEEGNIQDVKEMNPYHLVNALVKYSGIKAVEEKTSDADTHQQVLINVSLLKEEILSRLLPPKEVEEETPKEETPEEEVA